MRISFTGISFPFVKGWAIARQGVRLYIFPPRDTKLAAGVILEPVSLSAARYSDVEIGARSLLGEKRSRYIRNLEPYAPSKIQIERFQNIILTYFSLKSQVSPHIGNKVIGIAYQNGRATWFTTFDGKNFKYWKSQLFDRMTFTGND
jgi:hypothetical protein